VSGRYGHLRRWQIALRESGLSKAAKALGAFLSFRMNERGTIAGGQYPSIETLAKDASWSPRSADGALKELRQAGLIDVNSGKGRRVVNRYTLTIPDHLEVRVEYVLSGGKTAPEKAQTTTGKGAKVDVENAQGVRTSIAVSNAKAAASPPADAGSPPPRKTDRLTKCPECNGWAEHRLDCKAHLRVGDLVRTISDDESSKEAVS
jgi:hypothetical protein